MGPSPGFPVTGEAACGFSEAAATTRRGTLPVVTGGKSVIDVAKGIADVTMAAGGLDVLRLELPTVSDAILSEELFETDNQVPCGLGIAAVDGPAVIATATGWTVVSIAKPESPLPNCELCSTPLIVWDEEFIASCGEEPT
ncbi:MAG: hypothetical protein ACLQFM_04720 [Terriglobales bacterium]